MATAVMAQARNTAQPRTLTLMAGPIDTRNSPTRVNVMAKKQSIADYERRAIARVPARYAGAGRRVYPGFYQLASFMAMNADRHINAQLGQLRRLFAEDAEGAASASPLLRRVFRRGRPARRVLPRDRRTGVPGPSARRRAK